MKKLLFFALTLAFMLLDSFSNIKAEISSDIVYRNENTSVTTKDCVLDVFYNPSTSGNPVIVWFHGGGLTKGSKELPSSLCQNDNVVVGVEYRKLPEFDIPVILDDCALAVSWVKNNISRFGGDPSKIYIAGHSAGGYITSMLSLDKQWLAKYQIDSDKDILAYAPYSGQCISHYASRAKKGIPALTPALDSLAPLYHVRKGIAPFIVTVGDPELELYGRTEENDYFVKMLKKSGNKDVQFFRIEGFDHASVAEPSHHLLVEYIDKREGRKIKRVFEPEVKYDYTIEKDIHYKQCKTDLEKRDCVLDVAYRKGVSKLPVVIWIHGGGLTQGKAQLPQNLLSDGFVVFGVDYRKLPDVGVDELLDDCAAAVKWSLDHIEEYGGDPDKIYMSGHSGGGYIVSMLGLDKKWLGAYDVNPDKTFAALVPISGQCITHYAIRNVQGIGPLSPRIDEYAPIFYVRADSAPIILIVGDEDKELYCRTQENEYMYRMLRLQKNPNVTIHTLEGFTHGTMEMPARLILSKYILKK